MREHSHRTMLYGLLSAAVLITAGFLRFILLGAPFQTSDNCEVATRILQHPGYQWMLRESYGILVSLLVKLWVGVISLAGLPLAEFWWRAPIAFIGTLQIPLTYLLLRRFRSGRAASFTAAAFTAVLPIHVFLSHYLWGHEIVGLFCLTLAFWSLLAFFEAPSLRSGLTASAFCGLYLVSHPLIMPFFPCVFLAALFLGPPRPLLRNTALLARHLVWLAPLLCLWLAPGSFRRLMEKDVRLGFYLPQYLLGFVQNTGLPLALLITTLVALVIAARSVRDRSTLFFALGGAAYLVPLVFGAPPAITFERNYIMIGTFLLLAAGALVLNRLLAGPRARVWIGVLALCWGMTAWAAAKSLLEHRALGPPFYVAPAHGTVPPDPGLKACGYIVRRHAAPDDVVFAFSKRLEPPLLFYYFDRSDIAYSDLQDSALARRFDEEKNRVDLVLCSSANRRHVEQTGLFTQKVVIRTGGTPVLWIYGNDRVNLPVTDVDTEEYNAKFDREYAPRVSLK